MFTKVKKICLKLKIIIMSSNTIFILWMMKWGERDCTLLQILVCVSEIPVSRQYILKVKEALHKE